MTRLEAGQGGEQLRISLGEVAAELFTQGSLDINFKGSQVRLLSSSGHPGKCPFVIEPQRPAVENEGLNGFVTEGRYPGASPLAALQGLLDGRPHITKLLQAAAIEARNVRINQ